MLSALIGSSYQKGSNSSSARAIFFAVGRFQREWNSTMMSMSIADRRANLAEGFERLFEIGIGDVEPAGGLGIGIERPDLHAGDALLEQAERRARRRD